MLLAIPYLLAAAILRDLIEGGGPGWLHLLVLLCVWNAMKLTIMGPVSLILLIRDNIRDPVMHRVTCHADKSRRDHVPAHLDPNLEANRDALVADHLRATGTEGARLDSLDKSAKRPGEGTLPC